MFNYLNILDGLWALACVIAHLGLVGFALIITTVIFGALVAVIRSVCAGK